MSNINVYKCKDGRYRVYLKDTKQVISYPKYLVEQSLGRKLNDDEQVHHKDEDPSNNDISNLEIRMLGEHQRQHSKKYFDKIITCKWCGIPFLWTAKQQRNFHVNQKRKGLSDENPFCSKKCVGQYGRFIQESNKIDKH